MTRSVTLLSGLFVALLSLGCEDDSGGTATLDAGMDRAVDVNAETGDVAVDVTVDTGDGPPALADRAVDAAEVAPGCGCAADELCVQLNDGVCQGSPTRVVCRKVSEACRVEAAKVVPMVGGSCYQVSEACSLEYCPQPNYQCDNTAPCGNETASATVWCYGS